MPSHYKIDACSIDLIHRLLYLKSNLKAESLQLKSECTDAELSDSVLFRRNYVLNYVTILYLERNIIIHKKPIPIQSDQKIFLIDE